MPLQQLLHQLTAKLNPGSSSPQYLQWIKASVGSTVKLIPVEQVIFMRSDEKYTLVVWEGGEALIRKSMGKWGVNPADLAYIIGVSSYMVLMSDSNLLTVDKFGPNATLLNGQIGSLYGVPVIVSEHVRENLNDASPSTSRIAAAVRSQWLADERVLDAQVAVTFADESLRIEGFVESSAGPFRLVIAIGALTSALLSVEAA